MLWFYFRTLQGVVIPTFSGLMSAIWGLGFAGLCGFTLDPLVLVVFVLITARALSHSVQSMERYHEEYFLLHDKHAAIVARTSACTVRRWSRSPPTAPPR